MWATLSRDYAPREETPLYHLVSTSPPVSGRETIIWCLGAHVESIDMVDPRMTRGIDAR